MNPATATMAETLANVIVAPIKSSRVSLAANRLCPHCGYALQPAKLKAEWYCVDCDTLWGEMQNGMGLAVYFRVTFKRSQI